LSREITDTEENNFYDSIIIAKTVWNATLEFLHYGIERKMGVILRCKLAMPNEQMLKLPRLSLFQILSAICIIFVKYYLNWFTV